MHLLKLLNIIPAAGRGSTQTAGCPSRGLRSSSPRRSPSSSPRRAPFSFITKVERLFKLMRIFYRAVMITHFHAGGTVRLSFCAKDGATPEQQNSRSKECINWQLKWRISQNLVVAARVLLGYYCCSTQEVLRIRLRRRLGNIFNILQRKTQTLSVVSLSQTDSTASLASGPSEDSNSRHAADT